MDKKFIVDLQGKNFVIFEGLLNEFHQNKGKSISTQIVSIEPFIVQATVEGDKGIYQGIGDADEGNVNRMIVKHKYRMAETRAIARALRWYNNIGMCAADEMGGENGNSPSEEAVIQIGAQTPKKTRTTVRRANKATESDAVDVVAMAKEIFNQPESPESRYNDDPTPAQVSTLKSMVKQRQLDLTLPKKMTKGQASDVIGLLTKNK